MELFMEQAQPIIINLAIVILTIVASYLGITLKLLYAKVSKNRILKAIADEAVGYVQQRYTELSNEDKWEKAFEKASAELAVQKIFISPTRLESALEAAYGALKQGITTGQPCLPTLSELPGTLLDTDPDTEDVQETTEETAVPENAQG